MIVFTQQLILAQVFTMLRTAAQMDKKNEVGFDYDDIDGPGVFQLRRVQSFSSACTLCCF